MAIPAQRMRSENMAKNCPKCSQDCQNLNWLTGNRGRLHTGWPVA